MEAGSNLVGGYKGFAHAACRFGYATVILGRGTDSASRLGVSVDQEPWRLSNPGRTILTTPRREIASGATICHPKPNRLNERDLADRFLRCFALVQLRQEILQCTDFFNIVLEPRLALPVGE